MARRRFVWSPEDDCLIEVTPDYEQPGRHVPIVGDLHYSNLQATDGTDISTRTKHREYMKRNGLTTMDDFKDTWANAATKRADYFQGKRGTVTRDDIGRAIHQLESRSRKSR